MTLRDALHPLLMLEGLTALAVLTSDGLPIEVIGYEGADTLAAELVTVANTVRRSMQALELGTANRVSIATEQGEAFIVPLEGYVLVAVFELNDSGVAAQLIEKTKAPLARALEDAYELT